VKGRYRRAFFFLLDGAAVDLFAELRERGDMPNVCRAFPRIGSATSVFPSVTAVAYAPFVTGLFPGRTDIPGIRWFDRREYARTPLSASRVRDYTGLGAYLIDRDLAPAARTLFELVRPSMNIFNGIARGTGIRKDAAYFSRIPYLVQMMHTGDWSNIEAKGDAFLAAAADREERFTFHAHLSVDHYSHHHGPRHERVIDAYRRFDRTVGALCDRLASRGQLEDTLLCLSSDHGHTEVSRHLDLEGFFEARGLRTLYFPRLLRRWLACDAACMVGGNGMAHVYLRGQRGWAERPTGDELTSTHPTLVDDLLGEEAVHVVAHHTGEDGAILVRSRAGDATVRLDGDRVHYQVSRGADPFGYTDALPGYLSRAELLARTQHTDYPDAPLQLAQLFASHRTGDLVVSALPGWDLRARFENPEHRSSHGTLHRGHMTVPFAMSHPLPDTPIRTVDTYPTVLSLLGEPAPAQIDGRCLVT
jgi:arylsulfatase A-like enzyme